jgi:hypothetical protein
VISTRAPAPSGPGAVDLPDHMDGALGAAAQDDAALSCAD